MQLQVRRFGPDDWEPARAARLASVRDGFGEDSDFYREQAAMEPAAWRAVLAEHVRFGAFDGDRPVGTACWRAGDDGDGVRVERVHRLARLAARGLGGDGRRPEPAVGADERGRVEGGAGRAQGGAFGAQRGQLPGRVHRRQSAP